MATRLYLHQTASGVAGTLPTTEQSTKTSAFNYEAQTNNRSMNTTIGTAQQTVQMTSVVTPTQTDNACLVTKFISSPLNQTSVAANTWTYNFSVKVSSTTVVRDHPSNETNDRIPACCYVWRPSTGAKVANIIDGNTAAQYYDVGNFSDQTPTTAQSTEHGTFAGSAVTCQVGDVIVLEAWVWINTSTSGSATYNYYYDGTTVTTTNGPTVSNHAAFLETPENLSFQAGGAPIDMTESAAKTYSNKFITKV